MKSKIYCIGVNFVVPTVSRKYDLWFAHLAYIDCEVSDARGNMAVWKTESVPIYDKRSIPGQLMFGQCSLENPVEVEVFKSIDNGNYVLRLV